MSEFPPVDDSQSLEENFEYNDIQDASDDGGSANTFGAQYSSGELDED